MIVGGPARILVGVVRSGVTPGVVRSGVIPLLKPPLCTPLVLKNCVFPNQLQPIPLQEIFKVLNAMRVYLRIF